MLWLIEMKTKQMRKTAAAFTDHQQQLDNAKNKRLRTETGRDKLDPRNANNPARRNHKTGTSQKKTAGGKQLSPAD